MKKKCKKHSWSIILFLLNKSNSEGVTTYLGTTPIIKQCEKCQAFKQDKKIWLLKN